MPHYGHGNQHHRYRSRYHSWNVPRGYGRVYGNPYIFYQPIVVPDEYYYYNYRRFI